MFCKQDEAIVDLVAQQKGKCEKCENGGKKVKVFTAPISCFDRKLFASQEGC